MDSLVIVAPPGDTIWANVDADGWPLIPPTQLTLHRTSKQDERSRQIVWALDGKRIGELLYGQTRTIEIAPGPHRLRAHNTLVWKTVAFEAEPGSHVHFTVWNQSWGWYYVMLFFLGAAPLWLGLAPGRPDTQEAGDRRRDWVRARRRAENGAERSRAEGST
jgi:hypothetical protein